jgi:hypothetical protein
MFICRECKKQTTLYSSWCYLLTLLLTDPEDEGLRGREQLLHLLLYFVPEDYYLLITRPDILILNEHVVLACCYINPLGLTRL